jgi:hypothetical protein
MKMDPSSRIGISPVTILARNSGARESKILGKHCLPQRENFIHLINVINSCPMLSAGVTRRVGKTTCGAQLCDYRSCPKTVLYQNCSLTEITQFELVLKSVSSDGGQFPLRKLAAGWRAWKWPSPEICRAWKWPGAEICRHGNGSALKDFVGVSGSNRATSKGVFPSALLLALLQSPQNPMPLRLQEHRRLALHGRSAWRS